MPLTAALTVGAVVSRLTVTETGPAVPTTFVAVQERVNVPSVENVSSTQPVFVSSAPAVRAPARRARCCPSCTSRSARSASAESSV